MTDAPESIAIGGEGSCPRRFFEGDTIYSSSEVLENASQSQAGMSYRHVRTTGYNRTARRDHLSRTIMVYSKDRLQDHTAPYEGRNMSEIVT